MIRRSTSAKASQQGFTILEMMVATSVFAVVLLVLASGVISLTNYFVKGITANRTQATARSIADDVTQQIEFGQGGIGEIGDPQGTDPYAYCVEGLLYSADPGKEVQGNQHGLVKNTGASCGSSPDFTGGREMLAANMRVSVFDITPINSKSNPSLFKVHIRIISGDDDLLTDPDSGDWSAVTCKGGAGSQYCAVSDLITTVQNRSVGEGN